MLVKGVHGISYISFENYRMELSTYALTATSIWLNQCWRDRMDGSEKLSHCYFGMMYRHAIYILINENKANGLIVNLKEKTDDWYTCTWLEYYHNHFISLAIGNKVCANEISRWLEQLNYSKLKYVPYRNNCRNDGLTKWLIALWYDIV